MSRTWSHGQRSETCARAITGVEILQPAEGALAVGEGSGPGRMPSPRIMSQHRPACSEGKSFLKGRTSSSQLVPPESRSTRCDSSPPQQREDGCRARARRMETGRRRDLVAGTSISATGRDSRWKAGTVQEMSASGGQKRFRRGCPHQWPQLQPVSGPSLKCRKDKKLRGGGAPKIELEQPRTS